MKKLKLMIEYWCKKKYKGEDMGKKLFIAEKPSVAQEFAKALKMLRIARGNNLR